MKPFTPKSRADFVSPTVEHHGNVTDILTDLLHWCDHNDEDFDECLTMARKYHAQECDHADDTAGE